MYKKLNRSADERLENFKKHMDNVELRDDIYIEYVTLVNLIGDYEEAIGLLTEALSYPENLGEGKLAGSTDNEVYYYLGECYQQIGEDALARENFLRATLGIDEPASAMYYNDQPPENIFFQGVAYKALDDEKQAKSKFNKLIAYDEKHIFDDVKIDYFAVSLPDFLIFVEQFILLTIAIDEQFINNYKNRLKIHNINKNY